MRSRLAFVVKGRPIFAILEADRHKGSITQMCYTNLICLIKRH